MLRLNGATLTSKDGLNACTGSRSHTFIAHIRAADTVLSLNRLTFRGGVAADSALWCAAGGRRAGARRPSGRILFDALQQNAGALASTTNFSPNVRVQIEFHPGDDLSLILVSDDAEAESWLVETVDDQGVRQICERIASGTWVSSHRQIALGEIAWDVGLQAMEPKGKRVMISQGATILQDTPHPGSFEDDSLDGAFDGLI